VKGGLNRSSLFFFGKPLNCWAKVFRQAKPHLPVFALKALYNRVRFIIQESDLKLIKDRKPSRPLKANANKASSTDGKVSVKGRKKGGKK